MVQHGTRELVSGAHSTHVACSCLALSDNIIHSLGDAVRVVIESQMSQHHRSGEDQSGGVGLVLALDIKTDVTASRLENGNLTTHVASRDNTWSTNQTGTNVGQDATVQVGHDHDIELLWLGDTLHGGVVDNHVVGLDRGVLLTNLADGVAEETIGQLHDVGLVDASDLATVVGQCEREGKLGDALRLCASDDLQALDDTGDRLVLQTRVLSLGVLTDDAQVNVLVTCLVAGNVLDQDNGGVNVEFLTEGDVEGLVTGAVDGGVEDSLQSELVALEGGNGLAEELLRVLAALLHTGDINLLPLDGHIVGLEDGLY